MTSLLVRELLKGSRRHVSVSSLLGPRLFHTTSHQQAPKKKAPRDKDPVPNKLETFLAQIESTKHHISIQDIEQFKPRRKPRIGTPEYEAAYNDLTSTLLRSFSKGQFYIFFRDAGLSLPSLKTKAALAAEYVEKRWDWPPASREKEERRSRVEVVEKTFPMSTQQSFLLMGKDGSNLLKLSQKYNVHLAFSYNPLSLKVEGLKSSLSDFTSYMENFYRDVQYDSVPIATQSISLDTAHSISRATGAYVFVEDNQYKITYLQSDMTALHNAQYLLQKESSQADPVPLVASMENPDQTEDGFISSSFSLYPFSPPHGLPWQVQNKSAFRLRRVGRWLANTPSSNEAINLAAVSSSSRRVLDVKDQLLSGFKNHPAPQISAFPGHVLFLSPSSLATKLTPPLKGSVDFATALRWSDNHPESTLFLPRSPFQPFSGDAGSYHRKAVYIPQVARQSEKQVDSSPLPVHTIVVETATESNQASVKSRLESTMDILLPDRQYDLRITACHEEPADIPPHIADSLALRLKEDEQPPLSFDHDSVTYVLCDYTNQQKIDHENLPPYLLVDESSGRFDTNEIIDIKTGDKYITSRLVCPDVLEENAWSRFLTGCSHLSGSL